MSENKSRYTVADPAKLLPLLHQSEYKIVRGRLTTRLLFSISLFCSRPRSFGGSFDDFINSFIYFPPMTLLISFPVFV